MFHHIPLQFPCGYLSCPFVKHHVSSLLHPCRFCTKQADGWIQVSSGGGLVGFLDVEGFESARINRFCTSHHMIYMYTVQCFTYRNKDISICQYMLFTKAMSAVQFKIHNCRTRIVILHSLHLTGFNCSHLWYLDGLCALLRPQKVLQLLMIGCATSQTISNRTWGNQRLPCEIPLIYQLLYGEWSVSFSKTT